MLQADVNVSLTAMGLLWNAADLLSKMQLRRDKDSSGPETQALTNAEVEELLRLLLGALQVRSFVEVEVIRSPFRVLHANVLGDGLKRLGSLFPKSWLLWLSSNHQQAVATTSCSLIVQR